MFVPYLSLMDTCVLSHSVIFSFDHPAATWGLVRSLPACPNSKSNTMNGETGPSISIDFFASSSGDNVIKLDNDRSVLIKKKNEKKIHSGECTQIRVQFEEVT